MGRILAFLGVLACLHPSYAGDILRGGAGGGAARKNADARISMGGDAANIAKANAKDRLARTTQALASVQAMQAKARASAGGDGVPDGLQAGGLEVLSGANASWVGAGLPSENGGVVTINQTDPQAMLHWKTFNIGKNTTLNFNQTAGGNDSSKWIAFNKVFDPSGKPSRILGRINADGQVYVINQNGIIFGESAQVNTRALAASALPINDNLISRGLLNNPDAQFLFSTQPQAGDTGDAFYPRVVDPDFYLPTGTTSYTTNETLALNSSGQPITSIIVKTRVGSGGVSVLALGSDYAVSVDPSTKRAMISFTASGLIKVGTGAVSVGYAPMAVSYGNVSIASGAQIRTPVVNDGNGGRVILAGANVTNAGTISTPAGQTVLAAGQQVGFDDHANQETSLRGLDVWVGAVAEDSGAVVNTGLIQVLAGNLQIVGKRVEQNSIIESSTTVDLNGRIDLRASYGAVSNPKFEAGGPQFYFQNTGTIEIGPDSVTRVLPDYASSRTVPGIRLTQRSQVNLEGNKIHLGKGSIIWAPNGDVTARAGQWVASGISFSTTGSLRTEFYSGSAANGYSQRFLSLGGQIYQDASAVVSVAGTPDVFVPMAQSIVDITLRGPELADSPLQRNGLLRSQVLTVDLRRAGVLDGRYWMGTPLGDATGFSSLISRNAAQLTAEGGNVTMTAGDSIVVQKGAQIDVSGGYFHYEGGMVNTTRLLRGGMLVDIADASPNFVYDGVFTGRSTSVSAKWGIKRTYAVPLMNAASYQQSYLGGAAGGTIKLSAPSLALDGDLVGQTVQGMRDRASPVQYSSLKIGFDRESVYLGAAGGNYTFLTSSPRPPAVVFSGKSNQTGVGSYVAVGDDMTPLPESRKSTVILSPDLVRSNAFGNLLINNPDGEIIVPDGVEIAAPAKGAVQMVAANVDVKGTITAPGGEISLTAYNISPVYQQKLAADATSVTLEVAPAPNLGRGWITLGENAALSVAGLIVDEREDGLLMPSVIAGGSIKLESGNALNIKASADIDIEAGGQLNLKGSVINLN